ncbi:hypothetical protein IWT25_02294 [Secundilactobacillus pentosiphilus]|uniref:Uncharacterized protein n=1 Tax=Secundilactobacillus pentosiphilus TaxID=1714682 RepID=A0A1Z5IZ87_9LACO|nr:HK97 gp10 family phage protein [Secundilactobacillus pentosiphilus]GAX06946.1 hypothetical protein IWT25_02294 [Secundilactobacillus pentosiphilus]
MADLDEQMMAWYRQVGKLIPSTTKKVVMTTAAGEVLRGELAKTTRAKHYQENRTKGVKHLADSVELNPNDIGGEVNGSTVVGFTGKDGINHGRIARFLNDGTKKIVGDQFVDHSREIARPLMLKAEYEAYKKLR